jgi:hypothetical protein
MNMHIVHDGAGAIASVHRTVDGAAHHLAGHAPGASLPNGTPLGIQELDAALDENAVVRITYGDAPALIVERHAVNV